MTLVREAMVTEPRTLPVSASAHEPVVLQRRLAEDEPVSEDDSAL